MKREYDARTCNENDFKNIIARLNNVEFIT